MKNISLDKKLKEIIPYIENKNHRKVLYFNRVRYAIKLMRKFLKEEYNIMDDSPFECFKVYCYIMNYAPPTRNNYREYLFEIYTENEDPNIRALSDFKFYSTTQWKVLRKKVLKHYGEICMKCKSTEYIAVDHILPRSLHPHLELKFENLQVLCRSCNSSKSNISTEDYRNQQFSINN